MKKGVLHQKDIAEICVHEHKKVEGPTKALVAVVSLAVTLATMGAGAELGALAVSGMGKGIAATTISGMTQGAFTALCSRSAVSLLENRGNVGHVLHDLTSKESLKGFAKDAITTGLIGPGTRVSGIIPTLTQQLVRHAVKSAVGSAFGEKHAFRGFFKDVVVDTVGAVGANMIGDQFHGKKINALSHKLAHAVLGGAMGYVLEGKDGVTPGAVSSVLSETLMEELTPKQALGQSDEEYRKVVERTSAMVRMITASTALLLRQDMALMDRIGVNAIENNFMRHLEDVVELDEDDPIWQMDKEEALKELQARHEMLGRDGGDIGEFAYEHPEEVLTVASMVPGLGVVAQVVRGVTRGAKLYRQVKGVVDAVEEVAPTKIVVVDSVPPKQLLPGEGKVGTFSELKQMKKPDDDLARHHLPNSQYMKTQGVKHEEGISMMVEQPTPGTGGRHREIHKTMQRQDTSLAPRDALAQSVQKAREVYKKDGLYEEIRPSLLEVIQQNKTTHPELFKKP